MLKLRQIQKTKSYQKMLHKTIETFCYQIMVKNCKLTVNNSRKKQRNTGNTTINSKAGKDDKPTTKDEHPLLRNLSKHDGTHSGNGEGKYEQLETEDTAGRVSNTKTMDKPKLKE